MINYNMLTHNLKRGFLKFSEKITKNLKRSDFKFISQMVYGIIHSQSCHLSKIGRSLNEDITLKKTIDRLSRNLNEFTEREALIENYIQAVRKEINEKTILIVDGSDITKTYTTKMEGISRVRDGSTGEYKLGYHTLGITALTPERKMPIPVYYDYLIKNDEKFIIRAKKNRDVIYGEKRINIAELAEKFKGKYKLNFTKKNGFNTTCKISIIPIKLPCRPNDNLNLVVCYGFGKEPMMLITNLKSDDKRLSVAVVKVYLMRWRIEEYYRFKKNQFKFEDLRVRSLNSIRNLDLILMIVVGYIGYISEKQEEKLYVMELIKASKRIYTVANFVFYAIADGLFVVLSKGKSGIADMLRKKSKSPQFSFFVDRRFSCF